MGKRTNFGALVYIAAFLTGTDTGAAALGWLTLTDPVSGTSLEYPRGIFAAHEYSEGHLVLHTRDQRAVLRIYAEVQLGQAPSDKLREALQDRRDATVDYNRAAASFFAISGTRGRQTFYTRCNLSEGYFHCFDLTYPTQETAAWNAIVTRISKSLKASSIPTMEATADDFGFDREALLKKLRTVVPGMSTMGVRPMKVPTVSCPASTMTGDEPPPELPSEVIVNVPPELANAVSFYQGPILKGILGPRGWTCRQYSGSSGSSFIIAPTGKGVQLDDDDKGPRIFLSFSDGDTSGRYAVAEVGQHLFPTISEFVENVRKENADAANQEPFKHDTYYYLSPTVVVYRTAANAEGIGTWGSKPTALEVRGLAYLSGTEGGPGLSLLRTRLPADLEAISRAILLQSIDGESR